MNYYKAKEKWLLAFRWSPYIAPFKKVKDVLNQKQSLSIRKQGKLQVQEFIKTCSFSVTKKIPFISPLQRAFKTFVIYKMEVIKSNVVKQFKRVSLKSFKDYYNNPDIVGFTPNYNGFRKSRALPIAIETLKSLNNVKHEYRDFLLDVCAKPREVHTGSPDSNTQHLKQFLNKNNNIISTEELLQLSSLSPDWFKYAICDFNDPREMIYAVNFNPKAYPGHMTSRLLAAKQKGATISSSVVLATTLYHSVRKMATMNHSLWDMFAREKDIKLTDDKEVSTRVVLTTEEYVTHLTSWVCQKILSASQNHDNCKFHIKGEYDGIKAYSLYKKLDNYDFYLDADWSFFDSTIDTAYLEAACLLFFTPSIDSKETGRLMFFIISSIIHKNVIVPPGVVVQISRGNPSGHPCVTAINCVVNCLRWANIGRSIYGDNYKDYMDIEVYGDDAIVMLRSHKNLKNIDKYCTQHGYPSDPLVCNLFPVSEALIDVNNAPDFLKRRMNVEGIAWNPIKLIQKLIYQPRIRSVPDQIEVIQNFISTAPCDSKMNEYLLMVIDDIISDPQYYYLKDKVEKFKIKLPSIINRFRVKEKDPLEGFIYHQNVCSSKIELYIPRFKNAEEYLYDKELLIAIGLQSYSLSFLNYTMKTNKDFNLIFDHRVNTYYNFKFPKEFVSNLFKRRADSVFK